MSKVRSRFVQDVGILTLANFVKAIISFTQGILVARWLGPELYGVAALVMSVPSLVYTFFDARSSEASIKYLSEFDARGDREKAAAMCRLGYAIDFGIAMLAFIGVLIITPWASHAIVHRPELAWLIVVYATAFLPRSLTGTSYAVLVVHRNFTTIAFISILVTALRFGLILGLVLVGWNVTGVVLGNSIALTLEGLLFGFLAWSCISNSWGRIPWSATWSILRGYRREIGQFLIYNDLNVLIGMIPKQLDLVLLGYFRNPTEVGYYKLARNLVNVVGYIIYPLQSVTYPELARLWGIGDQQSFRKRVQKLAWQIGVPLSLLILSGVTLIPIILPLLVGDVYRPAIIAVQILLIGSATWLAFFWLRPFYLAMANVRQWMIGIILYSLTWLVLSLSIVPIYGHVGMAWCTLIATIAFHAFMGVRVCHGTS